VRALTDGVDHAFSAITPASGLADAVKMCAYGGTATLVGVPPAGRTLEVDVDRFVTKTIALEQVPEALDELHASKGIRTVALL
jgi:Zn-dependent alcohol dehydrogenase